MKFLMLDTNIYINMMVARDKSHKAESYEQLKKLLEYGEIKLIVPKIVITEVFRHIDNEIDKVGKAVEDIKGKVNNLYWINNSEALKIFDEIFKSTKSDINLLDGEFKRKSNKHKSEYKELFNKIFNHENSIVIEENADIIFKSMQRSIYKKRPFHYNEKEKDSTADAIIIETLININDLININSDDKIYFISRNPVDFSKDKKANVNVLHDDILNDIEAKGMSENIRYSTLFTKTLLDDFKEEIESVGITEELEAEAEYERKLELEERYLLQDDFERESAGLLSLSSDYEEIISEQYDIVNLMCLIEEIGDEITKKCEEYNDRYYSLDNLMMDISLEKFQIIKENNPLIGIFIDDYKDEDDIRIMINDLIYWKIGGEDYASFGEEFKYNDYFSINNTLLTFKDDINNEYRLNISGDLSPANDESDNIDVYLLKGNRVIEEGSIDIYYGYIEFDEDGNVGDGAESSITINIENINSKLIDIKENIISKLQWRIDKIQKIIDLLD